MIRRFSSWPLLLALTMLPAAAHSARSAHVYILTGRSIDVHTIEPNGQVQRSAVRVPTIAAGGVLDALAATPDGRFLYVEGCIDKPSGLLKRTQAIEAYDIGAISGVPRPIGAPVPMEGCFDNAFPQTLVIDPKGRYLFAAGGFARAAVQQYGAQLSTAISAFRIAQDGRIMQTASVDVPGIPAGARLALDASGRWLFYAGPRPDNAPAVAEIAVGSGGTLTLANTVKFPGALQINALTANPRTETLYIGIGTFSAQGNAELIADRIRSDGSLEALAGSPFATVASDIAVNRSGTHLYALGLCGYPKRLPNCSVDDVASFAARADGALQPVNSRARPLDLTGNLRLQPPYRYLYAMQVHAGFNGSFPIGPAVVSGPVIHRNVPVTSSCSALAATSGAAVSLYGPGDVVAIDPRLIVRLTPAAGVTNAPPSAGARVEFDQPGFPWLYSGSSQTPWVMLLVLKDSEFTESPGTSLQSLPTISVDSQALPNLSCASQWAGNAVDSGHPVSYVASPRALENGTLYSAFLVPTFADSVAAGLGQPPTQLASAQPAWTQGGSAAVTLPIYYEFTFTTKP